jgi:transcriptional regulator with XRE-family HTH domain
VTGVLTQRELLTYQVDLKGQVFRQIHSRLDALKAEGVTQKHIAARLQMDEGQLSRCLKGYNDLQIETLSDLARALECRVVATLEPLVAQSSASITISGAAASPPSPQPVRQAAAAETESHVFSMKAAA